MFDDGDDILNAVGIVLAVAIVLGVAVLALAAATAPDRSDGAPDADWRLERVNDTHARLVHDGGQPVRAANLVVTVDGLQRQVEWPEAVREGDAVTVRANTNQVVRVFWDAGEGNRVRYDSWRLE